MPKLTSGIASFLGSSNMRLKPEPVDAVVPVVPPISSTSSSTYLSAATGGGFGNPPRLLSEEDEIKGGSSIQLRRSRSVLIFFLTFLLNPHIAKVTCPA